MYVYTFFLCVSTDRAQTRAENGQSTQSLVFGEKERKKEKRFWRDMRQPMLTTRNRLSGNYRDLEISKERYRILIQLAQYLSQFTEVTYFQMKIYNEYWKGLQIFWTKVKKFSYDCI